MVFGLDDIAESISVDSIFHYLSGFFFGTVLTGVEQEAVTIIHDLLGSVKENIISLASGTEIDGVEQAVNTDIQEAVHDIVQATLHHKNPVQTIESYVANVTKIVKAVSEGGIDIALDSAKSFIADILIKVIEYGESHITKENLSVEGLTNIVKNVGGSVSSIVQPSVVQPKSDSDAKFKGLEAYISTPEPSETSSSSSNTTSMLPQSIF